MIENKSPSQTKIKLSVNLWSQRSLATLFVAGASFIYRALANSQAPSLIVISSSLRKPMVKTQARALKFSGVSERVGGGRSREMPMNTSLALFNI